MVRSALWVALLAAVSASLAVPDDGNGLDAATAFVPGAFIFEFEDNHVSGRKLLHDFIKTDHNQDPSSFHKKLANEDTTTRMEFNYKLFKGSSIQFNDATIAEDKATELANLPAVKQVWPVKLFQAPDPKVEWVGDPKMKPDLPFTKKAFNASTVDTFSPHIMTQVDRLRANGITGKGIRIAVIDTGVRFSENI